MAAEFHARCARDVNGLHDADKFVRKRALTSLCSLLFAAAGAPDVSTRTAFLLAPDVCSGLCACLSDASEANRELTCTLLDKCMDGDADGVLRASLLPALLPTITSRLGRVPCVEESEEIRLALARVCARMVALPSAAAPVLAAASSLSDVCRALALDAYHSVKVEACTLTLHLVSATGAALHSHVAGIAAALLPNAAHQRGPVRLATLSALRQLIPCAEEALPRLLSDAVLPLLRQHVRFDRVSAVRSELAAVLATWLRVLPMHVLKHVVGTVPGGAAAVAAAAAPTLTTLGARAAPVTIQAHMVVILLALCADEDHDVAKHAYDALVEACVAQHVPSTASSHVPLDVLVAASHASDDDAMASSPSSSVAPAPVVSIDPPVLISPTTLPWPFTDRAAPVARIYIAALIPNVLPLILTEVFDWTPRVRAAAAGALRTLIIVAEAATAPYLDAVVASLCAASRDEESAVVTLVSSACGCMGVFIPAEAQMLVLLPQLKGSVSGLNNSQHYAAALTVLASALTCMTRERLAVDVDGSPLALQVAVTLAAPHLCDDEPVTLRSHLCAAVVAFVRVMHGDVDTTITEMATLRQRRLEYTCVCEPVRVPEHVHAGEDAYRDALRVVLLHLQDTLSPPDVAAHARACVLALTHAWGYAHPLDVYAHAMTRLLPPILTDASRWDKVSHHRRVFDTLLRVARASLSGVTPRECDSLVSAVVDAFVATLTPSRDADVRVVMLALLDDFITSSDHIHARGSAEPPAHVAGLDLQPDAARSLGHIHSDLRVHSVCDVTVDAALSRLCDRVFMNALIPTAVWHVGRVAATLRKVAIACMCSLARRGLVSQTCSHIVWPTLRPVAQTCLSDDDGSTRNLTAQLLTHVFDAYGRAMDDDSVRTMYPELLKRLDDSNDSVRVSACACIRAFARAVPLALIRGTPCEYIIDTLLVHLDDPHPVVRAAVCDAASVWVLSDASYALRAVAQARIKARDVAGYDALLRVIDERGGASLVAGIDS